MADEEMSDVESESDREDGCMEFRGTIGLQPYMFEPKMDISEAAVRDAEKVTAQADVKERRFEAASKWKICKIMLCIIKCVAEPNSASTLSPGGGGQPFLVVRCASRSLDKVFRPLKHVV